MFIERVALLNFRNYQCLSLEMDKKINLLVGDNAQGKTNILEAIHYAGTFRSHRTNKDAELIKWDEKYFILKISGANQLGNFVLEIGVNREGKRKIKLNGLEKKKAAEVLGTVKVVLFSPEDLSLVKGSPVIRRRFMDNEISQLSPAYYHYLLNYQKLVSQRNTLLKDIRAKRSSVDNLDIWDPQIVSYGSKIINKRIDILKKIIPLARLIHRKITNGKEELEIKYICNVLDEETPSDLDTAFLDKLVQNRNEDIERAMTTIGPHRDDLSIFINGWEVKSFGSQGQQRTSSLSLKLAELELVKGETGEYPVLLLDDVMSELDEDRRHYLLESVQAKIQTIITATERNFPIDSGKTYKVERGSVHIEGGV